MHIYKYLNQRVRRIGESYGKYLKGFSKNNIKRLSFASQLKIEVLLPFTGYRKVLGKMPV